MKIIMKLNKSKKGTRIDFLEKEIKKSKRSDFTGTPRDKEKIVMFFKKAKLCLLNQR